MLKEQAVLAPVDNGRSANAERRSGTGRQRLMLRVAKLRCEAGEYPCIIQDVSEAGAKLRLFNGHPPDRHMYLELANGMLYAIERRWVHDALAGFRFSSAIDVEEFIAEPNEMARRPIRLRMISPARIVVTGNRYEARLVDVSAQGACVDASLKLPIGASLRVELAEGITRFGHLCWRRSFRHGIAFQDAFSLTELAKLATVLQPFEAATTTDEMMPQAIAASA